VLRYFPTTFMAGGGFDPLLDDTVDFDVRLERAGVHRCEHKGIGEGATEGSD
jgi:acetyl esterase/lipase